MGLFENNLSPYLTNVEGTTPASPAAGQQRLFVRSSDHLLCMVNSSGVVTVVGSGLANPMTTKGDVILGDTGGTPTRLGAGTAGQVLTSNGAAAFPSYQTLGGTANLASAAYRRSTGDYTIASSTFADVDATNFSFTITTGAHRVVLKFVGTVSNNSTGYTILDFSIDGTRVGGTNNGLIACGPGGGGSDFNASFAYLTDALSAGAHTFNLKWCRLSAGTSTIFGTDPVSRFSVQEVYAA